MDKSIGHFILTFSKGISNIKLFNIPNNVLTGAELEQIFKITMHTKGKQEIQSFCKNDYKTGFPYSF